MGAAGIDGSVWCDINEHFIDGINVDILRGKELQVDGVDLGRVLDVGGHPRRGDNIVDLPVKGILRVADRLLCFKKAGPSRNPDGLQGRGDGKADCLVRPRFIRNQKVCLQRIKVTLHTFHGSIERLEIDADIGMLTVFLHDILQNRTSVLPKGAK